MLRSSATSYFNADGLGTVTSLSNGSGSLTQTYTFDSFGKQTAATGSLTNSFQYTGRESDPETGLYYYRARYYDSSAGRFLSEDPLEFGASENFYLERNVKGSLVGVNLVLNDVGHLSADSNLLSPTGNWHGLQPYAFVASDLLKGPDNSTFGAHRTIEVKRKGLVVENEHFRRQSHVHSRRRRSN
jgi:RHS repeat-associated protein